MYINAYKPKGSVRHKNLISLTTAAREDVFEYIYRTRDFKLKARVGEKNSCLAGKYVAMISKSSYFRTQVAFRIAVESLGGIPIIIPLVGTAIEESLKDCDVIRNLRDYGIAAFLVDTSFDHDAELLERYADSPVIDANAKVGPCFALSSLLTVREKFGKLSGLKLTFIGDCSNGDNSILTGAAKCGMNLNVVSPKELPPSKKIVDYCRQFCNVELFTDKEDGIRGTDVIYVNENDFGDDYALDELDLAFARKDAIVLHSFPLVRKKSISDDAADCPQSMIFEQAANLVYALEAALSFI